MLKFLIGFVILLLLQGGLARAGCGGLNGEALVECRRGEHEMMMRVRQETAKFEPAYSCKAHRHCALIDCDGAPVAINEKFSRNKEAISFLAGTDCKNIRTAPAKMKNEFKVSCNFQACEFVLRKKSDKK